ncbi:MAG: glycoside hydrolase family 36 protein [Bryobacteraceae bacterium]
MHKTRTCFCSVGLFITAIQGAFCQTTARIRTEQTSLELRAQPASPEVVSLGISGEKTWTNDAPESLINSLESDGRSVKLDWKFNRQASRIESSEIAFVYESASPKLRLTWEWKAATSTGPIKHTIRIENLEAKEFWIPLQDSFQFKWRVDKKAILEHCYVEKGAGSPSAVGTHETALPVGYRWSGTSSTYAHPSKAEPREIIPWFAVQSPQASHRGWYVGLEFSGRTRLMLERDSTSLRGAVGLNPVPGLFKTRVKPHQTFDTPTVFVGAFRGGLDGMGSVLRPWVRRVLTNPRAWQNPNYPLLVNNSWGSGMQVDEKLAERMIVASAELGLEMFHIDAGWFRGVGDWYPDPKKFPHGLAPIADNAHRHGLKFGIWVDWTQAGLSTEPGVLNVRDPKVHDWTVSDLPPAWKPEPFKGETIAIGVPAAHAYAQREVNRIVDEYHLDMLEHDGYLVAQGCVREDHPHAPPDRSRMSVVKDQGSYFVDNSNSTDVSYHAVRAYYDIYANLRKEHPGLLLEICNDGGRMVDFGSASHGDYFSITDTYDPLSNRCAFYDASHLLPAAMLESYVEKWPTPKIENFRYMLRSGMMGWLTIMLDTNAWTEQQHTAAKQEMQLYKQELRPLIRDADIYHIGPRPDGIHWDGTEFFDSRRNKGVVYAFRGSTDTEKEHIFKLYGLVAGKEYQLRFHDQSAPNRSLSGRELLDSGLTVNLSVPNSSEVILIE